MLVMEAEHASARKAYEADMEASKTIDADIKKIRASQTKAQAEMDKAVAKAQEESDSGQGRGGRSRRADAVRGGDGAGVVDGRGRQEPAGSALRPAAAITKHQTEVKTSEAKKHFGKELKDAEKKLGEARKSGGKQEKEHAKLAEEVAALRGKMEGWGTTRPLRPS